MPSRPAPGSSGSTTATCGRSRSTSTGPARLRELVPDDRLVIAESGVREPATVARWRALGFDGALVGEALVRAGGSRRPRSARSSRPAPRRTTRPTSRAGRSSRSAASPTRTGSSPRSPPAPTRSGSTSCRARPASWRSTRRPTSPGIARAAGAGDRRPLIVAITADASPGAARRRSSPRSTPTSSSSAATSRSRRRRDGRAPDLEGPPPARRPSPATSAAAAADLVVARPRLPRRRRRAAPARHGRRAASGRDRDARRRSAWPRRSPGSCRSPWPAASTPANVAGALRTIPAVGVDVASGVERPRDAGAAPDQGPVPRRAVRQARPRRPRRSPERRRSARPRSTPACSTPTAPADGGWSATSVAATSPRR